MTTEKSIFDDISMEPLHPECIVQFPNSYYLHRLKEGGRVLGIENLSQKGPNTNGKFRISLYENLSTNGDDGNGKNYDIVFKQDIYGDYQLFINVDKAAKTGKLEFSSGVTTLAEFNARVIMDSNNYGLKFKATFPETSSKPFIN